MKNVIKPLGRSVLITLGLTAAAAVDAGIHMKIKGSGNTTLITWNDEMENIIKMVKSFENSGLLSKEVSKTIKNEAKEQKGGFFSMLLDTLGVSLLGNILAGKRMNRAGEECIWAGYGSSIKNKDF